MGQGLQPLPRDVSPPRFNVSAGPCSEVDSDARWLLIIRIMGWSLGVSVRWRRPARLDSSEGRGPSALALHVMF